MERIGKVPRVETETQAKWTPERLRAMKGGEKIAALTAYDFPMAKLLDEAGIPLILVGDSLGMVVLGYPDTTLVTMEEMEHHVRAVARASPRALVVADLPAHSYDTPERAVRNARRLMNAGAEAVKAEGGRTILESIEAIKAEGIPFCGHLGMLPQHAVEEGGYRIKGKEDPEKLALFADADLLLHAGAFAVVLELITATVARGITERISIPTIGIGSGDGCDGQILVTTDLWGTSPGFIPRHVKLRMNLAKAQREAVDRWKHFIQTGGVQEGYA